MSLPPDANQDLRLSEIFESFQGEGPTAGEPAVFLRLAHCNLRCRWCDTKYTWDFARYDYAREVQRCTLDTVLERLAGFTAPRLIITGGEPLLQQATLADLLARLPPDRPLEVETNGTLVPTPALLERIDQWNVSPKLDNSGEPASRRLNMEALTTFRDTQRAWLKCVVETHADVAEVDALVRELAWPPDRVQLMPQADNRTVLLRRRPVVTELAADRGYGVSDRLHIERFDGARGV